MTEVHSQIRMQQSLKQQVLLISELQDMNLTQLQQQHIMDGLKPQLKVNMVMQFLQHMVDLKLLTIPTVVGLIQQQIESSYGRVIRVMVLGAGSSWLMLLVMPPRLRGRISVQDQPFMVRSLQLIQIHLRKCRHSPE